MRFHLLLLTWALFSFSTLADSRLPAPEAATGWNEKPLVDAHHAMVVTANPYASKAAQQMLQLGGSAVDAMIAAQAVLTLVEPQSSGLGGGGFMVYWQQENAMLTTLDGRETAPMAAPSDLFLDDNQAPLAFYDAVVGGRSVGTPGTVRLMWHAHQRFGELDWSVLFTPAIRLATEGFTVSPRLARLIAKDKHHLVKDPDSRDYFFDSQGNPLAAGSHKTNPQLAKVLRQISQHGPDAFYQGALAEKIVNKVAQAEHPGYLRLSDLSEYQVKERPALCAPYRQYQICGMGPPSSGTLALGQILGMLAHSNLAALGPNSPQSWRLIADASRLAFADRNRYVADNDFVQVPTEALLAPAYLAKRAALLNQSNQALLSVSPGQPLANLNRQGSDSSPEFPSTTHLSIVDNKGNALSMTSTIENGFGSRLMVQGFLLNNELTDFAFSPVIEGEPVANRLEPGKRPRSSMAPTIVMQDNQPLLIVGSPGGSSIIGYVLHSIINILDWGMTPAQALHQPHIIHRGKVLEMEASGRNIALQSAMSALGFTVKFTELNSGLHAIMLTDEGITGAADPRREGVALAAD
ncbi:gamma-glutamyltransferase [Oceanisphaera pacifica]|uniref:Glutathione hydrolase proenzyme n=1 Tax=Oceanisphaera pacifica TaxID=2818389 RepID=A0ABS3NEN1_9GAMM|nr:gamma-glutamyltransferase [Oceanisphaera pacifica]MBO1519041.1 gamma-glutamyltransferase [Oceanisphaera pacifica]